MFDRMERRTSYLGLPLVALGAVLIGTLISDVVLSLSPLAGLGILFGIATLIVLAIELGAFFRRRRKRPGDRRPHFQWSYFAERHRRARKKSAPVPEEVEAELAESYRESWVP